MKLETYQDKRKQWRWRLKADNGKIIAASSEGYNNQHDMENNIRQISLALKILSY